MHTLCCVLSPPLVLDTPKELDHFRVDQLCLLQRQPVPTVLDLLACATRRCMFIVHIRAREQSAEAAGEPTGWAAGSGWQRLAGWVHVGRRRNAHIRMSLK